MVIGRVLAYITDKLCHFNLVLEFLLETTEENLPLARLESITERWDGSLAVSHREQDEFFVHKIFVPKSGLGVVHEELCGIGGEPFFALFRELLGEG